MPLLHINLDRYRNNLVGMPELPPDLVAPWLWKRIYELDIRPVVDAGLQDSRRRHRAKRMHMRKDRTVVAARDQVAAHAQPGLQIAHGLAIFAKAKCEQRLFAAAQLRHPRGHLHL